jgi:hypothetical protein
VRADIRRKYGFTGDLARFFARNEGPPVNKWHHYIPIYERYFARFRGTPVRFLEIGVAAGGSLRMWRRYFGEAAVICGIDIDPACAEHDGRHGRVRIGSQSDPEFVGAVLDELGGVDVVLDDGSHRMVDIRATLGLVFPRLAEGGVYMIEDLHTAYMPAFGGGLHAPANVFNDVRALIDDMHHWYHSEPVGNAGLSDWVSGIHVHDSIVVIDKNRVYPPVHSRVG